MCKSGAGRFTRRDRFCIVPRISQLRDFGAKVRGTAIISDAITLPPEPLALSAPHARALAARHCRHVDHGGFSCRDYHGVWQYLRLLDLVTTPRDHAAFYLPVLRNAIAAGRRRILISGAVDYSMLAVVLAAFDAEQVTGDITVADICETPIRLCQWYADRAGAAIATEVGDILAHRPAAPYDLIVTHSFLGAFAPPARARLVALWHDWLKPGGEAATVIRIRRDAPAMVTFTAEEIDRFRETVRREASLGDLDIDLAALDALARGYLAQRAVYPLGSRDALAALFEGQGFAIAALALEPLVSAGPKPAGPTLRGGAEYAKILAART